MSASIHPPSSAGAPPAGSAFRSRTLPGLLRPALASLAAAWALATLSSPLQAANIPVTNLADSGDGSLRQAIATAVSGDTVDATGIAGTIFLTTGQLIVNKSLTIQGPGAALLAIDGQRLSRVFLVELGTSVSLSGLTVQNGQEPKATDVTGFAGAGGGIAARCPLFLSDCTIAGNSTELFGGGGIFAGSPVTLKNCTVSGNSAAGAGGGIQVESILTMDQCQVSGNSAMFSGGGIEARDLIMNGCTITGNQANGEGGGICFKDGGTGTLRNSTIRGNSAGSSGGGIAFESDGTLLLENMNILDNRGNAGAEGWGGGGIHFLSNEDGRLTISGSTIAGNASTASGGGISFRIYNPYSPGALILNNTTVSGNSSGGNGGGIASFSFSGTTTLNQCTVTANTSVGSGGGIANYGRSALRNSTVSGNIARIEGGGIANSGTLTIVNSTLSGNSAAYGGGIYTRSSPLTIEHSTIAGNNANPGQGGGLYVRWAGSIVSLSHTIVAGNASEDLGINQPAEPVFTSGGYNLIGNTTFLTGNPTDLLNVDPLLGPLHDNGGPTFTHALLPDSPALDAGDPASTLTVDQRGLPRPVNGRIDIGAFEAQCDIPTVAITSPTSGAVFAVNTPVTFTATFTGENAIDTATWTIDGNLVPGVVDEEAKTVTATVTFTSAGVYPVQLTVANDCGNSATSDTVSELPAQVVVYDPSAGFVTGGGWILSPAGAANWEGGENLTGRASFGFVSRYQKGATVPTGQTEFQFRAGGLNFKSTSYQWLVVSGARAQYKGQGTVNGTPGYGFLLTAIDGQVSGGGGTDRFRIKIWDADGVVYDNQLGAADSATPTTALGGGSIVIRK